MSETKAPETRPTFVFQTFFPSLFCCLEWSILTTVRTTVVAASPPLVRLVFVRFGTVCGSGREGLVRQTHRQTDTQPSLNILMPLVWTLKCEDNCNSRFDFFFLSPCYCVKTRTDTHKLTHALPVTHLEVDDSCPALLHWARMEIAQMDYISVIAYFCISTVHLPPGCSGNCYSPISRGATHDRSWAAAAATCRARECCQRAHTLLAFLSLSFFYAPLGLVASNIQERQMKCSL